MSKSPDVFEVDHFDFVYDVSRHVGTDTGSDTDISPHISLQIEPFAKEAICRVYQQKFGHILQRIGLIYWTQKETQSTFTNFSPLESLISH